MLLSLLKHYLELCITNTALNVSQSLSCFTTCISHGVENYFLRLWGRGISDALFTNVWWLLQYKCIPYKTPVFPCCICRLEAGNQPALLDEFSHEYSQLSGDMSLTSPVKPKKIDVRCFLYFMFCECYVVDRKF